MANQGFRNKDLIIPYMYQDNATASLSVGIDGNDSNIAKISASSATGVNPTTAAQITINPAVNGDVTLKPNGTGSVNIDYATANTIALYSTNGALSESSLLTDGQLLIGSTGGSPTAASLTSSDGSITITQGAGAIDLEVLTGGISGFIQQASTSSSAFWPTTSIIPYDDTIPQSSEGSEFLTVSITPVRSTSKLYIRFECTAGAKTSVDSRCVAALFQDSTADALAASMFDTQNNLYTRVSLTHIMDAGTTSLTTFKIRIGSNSGADLEINGDDNGGRILGGSSNAVLYVYELYNGIGLSGFGWTEVTTTPGPTQMAVGNGYIANAAGSVGLTLPVTASAGDMIRIAGKGAGGWNIVQGAGQTIHFGNVDTTTGAGGSLASTDPNDCLELLCIVADTWEVLSSIGNITIV